MRGWQPASNRKPSVDENTAPRGPSHSGLSPLLAPTAPQTTLSKREKAPGFPFPLVSEALFSFKRLAPASLSHSEFPPRKHATHTHSRDLGRPVASFPRRV